MQTKEPSFPTRIWEFLGHASLIHWLWQGAGGFIALWKAQGLRMMPDFGSHPAGYIGLNGAIFCGTVFTLSAGTKAAKWTYRKLKRVINSHGLIFQIRDGSTGGIEFTHFGEEAIWKVRKRIISTIDGSVNPDPLPGECYLYKGGKKFRELPMKNGESTYLVIANINSSEWRSGDWLAIPDADNIYATRVPDSGVLIVLEFCSDPPMRDGNIEKYIRVGRVRGGSIRIEEVSGN